MRISRSGRILPLLVMVVFAASCRTTSPVGTSPVPTQPDAQQLSPLSPVPTAIVEPATDVPTTEAVQATPGPDSSAITGRVVQTGAEKTPIANTVVWLGRVFWNEQRTEAAFAVAAGAGGLSAITDATGRFYITGVTPGEFVVVVGNLEDQYRVVAEPGDPDTAQVFVLLAGEILQVGELAVTLDQL